MQLPRTLIPILLSLILLAPAAPAAEPALTWDLSPLYADLDHWQADFERVERDLPALAAFAGTLADSPARLLACLRRDEAVARTLGRLRLHAELSRDLALTDDACRARFDRAAALADRVAAARAFLRPEIVALGAARLAEFRDREPGLRVYEHAFADILAAGAHTLSADREALLARAGGVLDLPADLFFTLAQLDLRPPRVADDRGGEVAVTGSVFEAAKTSLDAGYRERAYRAFFQPYREHENTFAALLAGKLGGKIFQAETRGYGSALEAALAPDHIPTSVYRNLIAAVGANLEPLRRWTALKRERLGVAALHDHDSFATLFPADRREYTYAEACELILAALAPLGAQYQADLRRVFAEGWIDVLPAEGKAQGAYSSDPVVGAHPYVLINWHGQVTELFELAHELGHCLHTWYTVGAQPDVYADTAVFAGEVASTTNEVLLARYLIDHAADRREKLVQIEQQLNNTKLMVYWTTFLAEFELAVYERAAAGASLTPADLCALVADLYARYYGPDLTVLPEDTYIWAPLRHLYIVDFYLYQYATSYAAAEQLAADILADPAAADRYLEFLRSGTSRHPLDALARAGVDLLGDAPLRAVARGMSERLDELERLLAAAPAAGD